MTIEQHSAPASSFFTSATTGPPATIDIARYKRDGFALIENFLNREELAALRTETTRICREELGPPVDGDAVTVMRLTVMGPRCPTSMWCANFSAYISLIRCRPPCWGCFLIRKR